MKEPSRSNAPIGENNRTRQFDARRKALCSGLVELIETTERDLAELGFSPDAARFECVHTLKMILDDLYDQSDVGFAGKEWYREYVSLNTTSRLEK